MASILSFSISELALLVFVVALIGSAKGGLGGAFALFGVPLLSMIMPSLQAAAILLPILILMDAISVWIWRGKWDIKIIYALLPMGIFGIVTGWYFSTQISDSGFRIMLGIISIFYVLKEWFWRPNSTFFSNQLSARFWGFMAGLSSYVAHAGGPPFQIHVLPLRLNPSVYSATAALFFATLNLIKLIPYAQIGQFNHENLSLSLSMMPVAIVFTLLGAKLVRNVNPASYYPILNAILMIVGIYLVYDGISKMI